MKKGSSQIKQSHELRPPVFVGGKEGINEHIKSHMRYPEEALKNKISGTVAVDYDVDVFGNVIDARVKRGIGYGCDEEAVRIVKLMKYQKRKYPGKHVVFHLKININFRIHEGVKLPEPGQINYHIKKSDVNSPAPAAPNSSPVITYTIRLD